MCFNAHRQNIRDQNNSVGSAENRKFPNENKSKRFIPSYSNFN